MAFYQWEPPPLAGGGLEGGRTAGAGAGTVTTISLVDDMPPDRHHCRVVPHNVLAHCDGLVLVATREGNVHLFNPAVRQAVTLPWSPGSDEPSNFPLHQSFGLGRDPRSGAYKAARFFYRWVPEPGTCWRDLTPGMEVFTVGADRRWRELATQPPLPVLLCRTAASFKGSLLWNVDEEAENGAAPPGFLRLSLEDETFGVTPAPPCHSVLDYCRCACALSELRGELCLVRVAEPDNVLEMWVTQDAVRPRWERRYAIRDAVVRYLPRPVARLDDGIVFHDRGLIDGDGYLCHYSFQTGAYKEMVKMHRLRGYHHRRPGASIAALDRFFVIPYRESILQLNHVMA